MTKEFVNPLGPEREESRPLLTEDICFHVWRFLDWIWADAPRESTLDERKVYKESALFYCQHCLTFKKALWVSKQE